MFPCVTAYIDFNTVWRRVSDKEHKNRNHCQVFMKIGHPDYWLFMLSKYIVLDS